MPGGRLDEAAVAALVEARHGDPFAVLGRHLDAAGTPWLRVLLPGVHGRARSLVLDLPPLATLFLGPA